VYHIVELLGNREKFKGIQGCNRKTKKQRKKKIGKKKKEK